MNLVLESARSAIARHRLALMKYCVVTALLCSLISLAAQQFNDNLIPLGTTLAINLVFLFGLDWVMLKALRNEPYSYRDFSQFAKYFKALLPLFGIYAVILAAGVFALQAMIHLGAVLLVLPALLALSVIFLNCINHLTLFSMIETHQSAWQGEAVFSIQKTDLAHRFKNDNADLAGKSGGVRAQCVCLRSADRRCAEKCAGNYGSADRSLFLNESQLSDSKRWHAAGCQLYRNRVRNDVWNVLLETAFFCSAGLAFTESVILNNEKRSCRKAWRTGSFFIIAGMEIFGLKSLYLPGLIAKAENTRCSSIG